MIMTFIGLFLLSVSMNEYIDPRSRLSRMGGGLMSESGRDSKSADGPRPASEGRQRCRSRTCAPTT